MIDKSELVEISPPAANAIGVDETLTVIPGISDVASQGANIVLDSVIEVVPVSGRAVKRPLSRSKKMIGERDTVDPVELYLREIGQYDLLTGQEEVMLAETMRAGNEASARLAETAEGTVSITHFQDEQLVQLGDKAKDDFIKANLRLVVSIAKRYARVTTHMKLLDIIQEGNEGLMRAVEKFDPDKGFKFSTYATWWIRQSIGRGMGTSERGIRLPQHMVDHVLRYDRIMSNAQITDVELSDEEIMEQLNVSAHKLRNIREAAELDDGYSLDAPIGESESDTTYGDFMSDPAADIDMSSMLDGISNEALIEWLRSSLDKREADILMMRHGIVGEAKTLQQIGDHFNLTRERIRQLESGAMRKLSNTNIAKEFKEFI